MNEWESLGQMIRKDYDGALEQFEMKRIKGCFWIRYHVKPQIDRIWIDSHE